LASEEQYFNIGWQNTMNGAQPLRVFAISTDGSVRVRIPATFEGAISMTTEDGSVNVSDGVKVSVNNILLIIMNLTSWHLRLD
jgi:hypothetical protein